MPGLSFDAICSSWAARWGLPLLSKATPEIVVTIPHIGRQVNCGLESRNSTGELVMAGKVGSERIESAR